MSNLLDRQTVKEIFWDRPEMTPEVLNKILENPDSGEYYQFKKHGRSSSDFKVNFGVANGAGNVGRSGEGVRIEE